MNAEWSTERVAEQFRNEIRERFARENASWLAAERKGIAEVKAKCDAEGKPYPDWLEERPSFLQEIYERLDIQITSNSVRVILPNGFAIHTDFVDMFGGTEVGWSYPSIAAVIVDGEPRVAIELILIDYWDDARHAKWDEERQTYKDTTAEALLERIRGARLAFTIEPGGPKDPADGLCTIEHWCDKYFEARQR